MKADYRRNLAALRRGNGPFTIVKAFRDNSGAHPENSEDVECSFAARHVRRQCPGSILDVGSYRHFIQGLSAVCDITSLDVRPRTYSWPGYTVVTGDAKVLP